MTPKISIEHDESALTVSLVVSELRDKNGADNAIHILTEISKFVESMVDAYSERSVMSDESAMKTLKAALAFELSAFVHIYEAEEKSKMAVEVLGGRVDPKSTTFSDLA